MLEWSLSLVSSFERVSVQPTDSTEILILDDDGRLWGGGRWGGGVVGEGEG